MKTDTYDSPMDRDAKITQRTATWLTPEQRREKYSTGIPKKKRGRPYKNPNLVPQGLADYIRNLKAQRDELYKVLTLVWNDTGTRFGMDKESNQPISELIRTAITKEKV